MTSDHPITRSPDHPITRSLPALTPLQAWQTIKAVLRVRLGEREYELWIKHARLWRIVGAGTNDQCMLIVMPRTKAVYGALRHKPTMQRLARKMNFALGITVEMDEYQLATYRERYGEPEYLEGANG